jgi:hypothetical protein
MSHRLVELANTDNSQLDDRYFTDLKGQYQFVLNFLLKSPGEKTPICSVRPVHQWDRRSVNCEVELEPGTYEVIPKIVAERYPFLPTVQKMVKRAADNNPQKLRQIGLQYDLAHAKGGIVDEDETLRKKKEAEKRKKLKGKKKDQKKKQMTEAMARMEQAMVQMRNEYNQCLNEKESARKDELVHERTEEEANTKESDVEGKSDKAPPGYWPEDSSKSELEVSGHSETPVEPKREPSSHETSPENDEKRKASPPTQNDLILESSSAGFRRGPPSPPPKSSVPSRDHSPLQSRRAMSQSTDTCPVFTPPTEPTDESDMDSSDSAAESESTSNDTSSSSDSDSVAVFPRLGQRKKQPWNAVCVIGLRVYAQHAGIKVREADQKADEAAELVPPKGSPTSIGH